MLNITYSLIYVVSNPQLLRERSFQISEEIFQNELLIDVHNDSKGVCQSQNEPIELQVIHSVDLQYSQSRFRNHYYQSRVSVEYKQDHHKRNIGKEELSPRTRYVEC